MFTSENSPFKCPYTSEDFKSIIFIFVLIIVSTSINSLGIICFLWKKKFTTLPGNNHLIRDVESATPSNENFLNDESSPPLTKQPSIMTKNEQVRVKKTGYDFTWLGFNITGNTSDGIFVEDVGPTNASGLIKAGDRVQSIKVAFEKMLYEDALAILSLVSPYDVALQIERTGPTKYSYVLHKVSDNSGLKCRVSPSSTNVRNFKPTINHVADKKNGPFLV